MTTKDGCLESQSYVVTWCVGHLVTMSYPEVYDSRLKRWSLDTLPFIPTDYKYEVISGVKKQFTIVSDLLNRKDVETIYVCTDSGREGEYIYRLVEQMAGVENKKRLRVWIDSQTEEEILKGIREAKDLSSYDNLAKSAYLRAKEDYLMGINFSRLLTLCYGSEVSNVLGNNHTVVSVGRVMTCVLGMVVNREREIRNFVKKPFFRVLANLKVDESTLQAEWKVVKGSKYESSPWLYKDNGFTTKEKAEELIKFLQDPSPVEANLIVKEKKKEKKNPPLLYNLAELQNACSKRLKISPDQTLSIVQELYEKKLVTYPRTDARVLSTAAAKEIHKNLSGLNQILWCKEFSKTILENGWHSGIAKTRYVNDKQITDHYAIVPTGQGLKALNSLKPQSALVYQMIVARFLGVFYPSAVYEKYNLEFLVKSEHFFAGTKVLVESGYLVVDESILNTRREETPVGFLELIKNLKKGQSLPVSDFEIKEGETSPPKKYNSGSMILAMENAGQLIEGEELRAQIKGSGIGTSATRAEILKKLVSINYLNLNAKTQVISPTLLGEMIYEVVSISIKHLLNPELTASWEKGLTYVTEGTITPDEYMEKLEGFIRRRTSFVIQHRGFGNLKQRYENIQPFYKKEKKKK
ncbi:DNA topoisomerase III [Lachnospiraceae bacterium TWA4]|nr:DNA topoisomerase III [Lachnospiraceae bacterium TWA4]